MAAIVLPASSGTAKTICTTAGLSGTITGVTNANPFNLTFAGADM